MFCLEEEEEEEEEVGTGLMVGCWQADWLKKEEERWSSCRGFRTRGGKAGSSPVLLPMAVEMISVKKLTESSGKYAFVVECRPLDGKQQQQREEVTRSRKFECKGWDDLEAQSKTLRFVMATDSLSTFRAFLFNEPPGGGREEVVARSDGSTTVGSTIGRMEGGGGATTIMSLGAFPGKIDSQGSIQINIRSYVCVRQKQLGGPRYAVALCRLENGRLRAMSFHEQQGSSVDEEGLRTGAEDQAVDRAVLFLRSMAFESWRKHGGIEALLREQQQQQQASATLGRKRGRERGLKHPCSVVEMKQGKKVDCRCGKNRSRGPMIACERCGALEHAECHGFRSGKQMPVDYVCSACHRAQREEVIVIRLEEQENLWSVQLDNLWTDEKVEEKEGSEPVCCICGCEDNEDLEALSQPCLCNGPSAAHPSCVTAAISEASQRGHPMQGSELAICHICGGAGGSVTGATLGSKDMALLNNNSRSSRRMTKADQFIRGTKRLRSALTNGVVSTKCEIVEQRPTKSSKDETDGQAVQQCGPKSETPVVDQSKLEVPLLGRRFSDAAATVPIKKRRIQLEVARSPSPPLKMASPRARLEMLTAKDRSEATAKPKVAQDLKDAEIVEEVQLESKGPSNGDAVASDVGSGECEPERHHLKVDERENVEDSHFRHINDDEVMGAYKVMAPGSIVDSKGKMIDVGHDIIKVVTEGTQRSMLDDMDDDSAGKLKEKYESSKRNRDANNDQYMCTANKFTQDESSQVVSAVGLQQPEVSTALEGDTDACSGERQAKTSSGWEMHADGLSPRSRLSDTKDLGLKLGQAVQEAAKGGDFSCSDPSVEGSHRDDRNGPLRNDLRADEEGSSSIVATEKDTDVSRARDERGNFPENESTVSELENTNTVTVSTSRQSSRTRDDRLHWDLNMDYAEWERPTEEDMTCDMELKFRVTAETVGESRQGNQEVQGDHQSGHLDGYEDLDPLLEKGRSEQLCAPDTAQDGTPVIAYHPEQLAVTKVTGEPGVHGVTLNSPENVLLTKASAEVNRAEELEERKDSGLEASNFANEEPVMGAGTLADNTDISNSAGAAKYQGGRVTVYQKVDNDVCMETSTSPTYSDKEFAKSDGSSKEPSADLEKVGPSDDVVMESRRFSDGEGLPSSPHGRTSSSAVEELEAEHVDYGDSDCRDDYEPEADESRHLSGMHAESRLQAVDVAVEGPADLSRASLGPTARSHAAVPGSQGDEKKYSTKLNPEGGLLSKVVCGSSVDCNGSSIQGSTADANRLFPTSELKIPSKSYADENLASNGEQEHHEIHNCSSGWDRGRSMERYEMMDNKEDWHAIMHEEKMMVKSEISGRCSEVVGRVKSSGWDQLPESFEKKEYALQAVKEGSGRGGRGAPQWANLTGRGASMSSNNSRIMTSQFSAGPGRGSLVRNDPPAERVRSDSAWSRDHQLHGRRVDDGFELSPRHLYREIGHGRGRRGSVDLSSGRGRPDSWFDSPSGPPTPWRMGPNGHLSPPGHFPEPGFSPRGPTNAAAVAAAKVESSGFVVAPDGTIIKAGGPAAAPIRGVTRPFGPAGCGGRASTLFSMGGKEGGGANVAMHGVGAMGLRDNMRGVSIGLRGRRSMGIGPSIGMGVGPGISANMPGRGASARGRGFNRFGGRFTSQVEEPMTESSSDRPGSRHADKWGQRERSPSPPSGRHSRISPVRRPHSHSRSRSRSPHVHMSPKLLTSSIGDPFVPVSPQPKKQSHSPISDHRPLESKSNTWPQSHSEKPDSPLGQSELPPPRLPLPPPPPRSQRSPPAGLKRLSDKRETDHLWEREKDRELDWERERPIPHMRTPPHRTSPHVVHGSALMDDRDRQLLAGICHISPTGRQHRQNALSGPQSTQEQSPHSSRGRSADRASDLRRLTGEEPGERERGAHGTRREELLGKGGEHNVETLRAGNDRDARDRRMGASARRDGGERDDEGLRAKETHQSGRDGGKMGGNSKYTISREGDDDVAPRRRRPPP